MHVIGLKNLISKVRGGEWWGGNNRNAQYVERVGKS